MEFHCRNKSVDIYYIYDIFNMNAYLLTYPKFGLSKVNIQIWYEILVKLKH